MNIRYISVLELVHLEAPLIENIPDINPKSQKKVWKIKKILNTGLINNNQSKYLINKKITLIVIILRNLLRTSIIQEFLRSFRRSTHSNKNKVKGE